MEARHRGHARVEDRIRNAKQTGLANFPCHDFANNAAWLIIVLMACDLIACAQRLTLVGELAKAEPKRLRYCILHAAGRIASSGRRTRLRLVVGRSRRRVRQARDSAAASLTARGRDATPPVETTGPHVDVADK